MSETEKCAGCGGVDIDPHLYRAGDDFKLGKPWGGRSVCICDECRSNFNQDYGRSLPIDGAAVYLPEEFFKELKEWLESPTSRRPEGNPFNPPTITQVLEVLTRLPAVLVAAGLNGEAMDVIRARNMLERIRGAQ